MGYILARGRKCLRVSSRAMAFLRAGMQKREMHAAVPRRDRFAPRAFAGTTGRTWSMRWGNMGYFPVFFHVLREILHRGSPKK